MGQGLPRCRLALRLEIILENVVGLRFFAPILDHDAGAADLRDGGLTEVDRRSKRR